METTKSEMKNTLIKINGRLDIAEEKIYKPEDVVIETIQGKALREKWPKKNNNRTDVWTTG